MVMTMMTKRSRIIITLIVCINFDRAHSAVIKVVDKMAADVKDKIISTIRMMMLFTSTQMQTNPLINIKLLIQMKKATRQMIVKIIIILKSTTAKISKSLKKTAPSNITLTITLINVMAKVSMQTKTIIIMTTIVSTVMITTIMIDEKCNRRSTLY